MTDRDQAPDADVGQRFQTLRQEDSGGAPPFGATLDRAYARRSRAPRYRNVGLAVATLVVGAALVRFAVHPRSPRPAIDLATVAVPTATDFLLRLPGAELLRAVPTLGPVSPPDARSITFPIDRRTP